MSPPANPVVVPLHPRTLKTMRDELKQARRDYDDALADMRSGVDWFDSEDRANEAEQRLERIREEFDAELLARTGLTVEDVRGAYAGALI